MKIMLHNNVYRTSLARVKNHVFEYFVSTGIPVYSLPNVDNIPSGFHIKVTNVASSLPIHP